MNTSERKDKSLMANHRQKQVKGFRKIDMHDSRTANDGFAIKTHTM